MNDGASFSNRTSKTPAEFEGFKKIIGVLWALSPEIYTNIQTNTTNKNTVNSLRSLQHVSANFRPSSASFAIYVKEKEYHVDAPPLQAAYTIISIKNCYSK
jgi:hypothetical protein